MEMISCDCSIDVDEPCRVCVETRRKARKEHKCVECRETIRVGQYYMEETGISADGDPFRYRTCAPCHAIRVGYCPGGYAWGELAQIIYDCLGFDYLRVPGADCEDEAEFIDEEDADRVRAHKAKLVAQ
jgi:hypothetical protein